MGLPNRGNNAVTEFGQPAPGSDTREFQHYVKVDPEGNVIALVEVEDNEHTLSLTEDQVTDQERHLFVNVTSLGPRDWRGAKIPKKLVTDRDFAKAREALQAHGRS